MKEVLVCPDLQTEDIDVPFPTITPDQIIIKVVVAGTNPIDWKYAAYMNKTSHAGDDIAGIVYDVGENITEFKKGDRVAVFHEARAPYSAFGEYAVVWGHTTFHIPKTISFEGAATIPTTFTTAGLALYKHLQLPTPWAHADSPIPLLIYGASSACGAFAVKLAVLSNIHPIIAIAGKGTAFVEGMIDKERGDIVIDYRDGAESMVKRATEALNLLGLSKIKHAFDAISENGSSQYISEILDASGSLTSVLPFGEESGVPQTVVRSMVSAGTVHRQIELGTPSEEWGFILCRYAGRALSLGTLCPHPFEVIPGGLGGVHKALSNLKAGKAMAVKYVLQISA